MIEDGTGIRYHAKAVGDVGTVIPPIILYRKAHINLQLNSSINQRIFGYSF